MRIEAVSFRVPLAEAGRGHLPEARRFGDRLGSASSSVVDVLVTVSIITSFAALVTAHVAVCAGLAARDPWWRGAVALVVPFLAPFWAFRERMGKRAIAWTASGAVYVATRVIEHAMAH